ncbi:guanylate kinase [Aliarcobacter butzleri]|uniref:guanylate kinase n=1 Tax=Aliarcobacter butzleri TaxID=28197 RepID=UPI001260997D|nr:guanylate kinase [Aliarcobacter butzleri]MCT7626352.1 guanylate kinase [Aliarcobacter butzleri]MCT7643913.1 guanylate kinase [Aliarcobacter butzleri]MDN5046000.1 guanylate kinase [Aliarcobacter butzleri]
MNDKKGAILIISGPSGCGKSTLLKEVYKNISDYYFSISTTTREPRVGEINGVDYFFVSKKEFEEDIKKGNFLEYAKVHDNYYGTSLKPIIQALNEGKLVIFDIDVQGHHLVRKKMNDSVTSVFITTPSLKVLEERLNNRNSDSLEVIEKRVKNAKKEIEFFDEYDYFIVNDNLASASNELVSIANIARAKAKLFDKEKIVSNWLN